MSNAIIKHQFDNHPISQRSEDGYVNLTQLCNAGGKKVNDYLRLVSTEELLSALSEDAGFPATTSSKLPGSLVQILKGGNKEQGTWAHPEIAIDCAQWVSVQLRIWANRTLVKIISGSPVEQPTDLEQRVQAIESQMFRLLIEPKTEPQARTKTTKSLKADLNHPNPEIKEISPRTKIRKLIARYCYETNQNYRNVYQYLYEQYKLRYQYDVYRQCEKTGQWCKLTQMETDGRIDEFHQMLTALVHQSEAA